MGPIHIRNNMRKTRSYFGHEPLTNSCIPWVDIKQYVLVRVLWFRETGGRDVVWYRLPNMEACKEFSTRKTGSFSYAHTRKRSYLAYGASRFCASDHAHIFRYLALICI